MDNEALRFCDYFKCCQVKTTLTELILNVNIGPQQGWTLNEYEWEKLYKSWNIKEVDKYTYKYTVDWEVDWLIETINSGYWEIDIWYKRSSWNMLRSLTVALAWLMLNWLKKI